MPYSIEWKGRGIYSHFTGAVTGEQILSHSAELHGDERFDSARFIIVDFLNTEDVSITIDQVKEIAARDSVAALTNPNIKVAIVSSSETVDVGGDLYRRNTADSPWTTALFETLAAAERWVTEPQT